MVLPKLVLADVNEEPKVSVDSIDDWKVSDLDNFCSDFRIRFATEEFPCVGNS